MHDYNTILGVIELRLSKVSYSVLYTYKGKPAILKATMTEIRICDEYNRLICRHPDLTVIFLFTLQMTVICLQNTYITKK